MLALVRLPLRGVIAQDPVAVVVAVSVNAAVAAGIAVWIS